MTRIASLGRKIENSYPSGKFYVTMVTLQGEDIALFVLLKSSHDRLSKYVVGHIYVCALHLI